MDGGNLKRAIYAICVFVLFTGVGEGFARALSVKDTLPKNKLRVYTPAYEQMDRFDEYVKDHGIPHCVFLGSSLVQTGINPDVFEKHFELVTHQKIDCYNFGMAGATLSTSEIMRDYLSKNYQPELFILGIAARDFLDARTQAEQEFSLDGELSDWLLNHSMLFRLTYGLALQLFPRSNSVEEGATAEVTIRSQIPRITLPNGYNPLLSYGDKSPIFGVSALDYPSTNIDQEDIAALEHMIEQSKVEHYRLLIIELPIVAPHSLPNEQQITNGIIHLARSAMIPVLSTGHLLALAATAFTDNRDHLHIYASNVFSAWLGSQIGKAFAANALDKVDDPVWFPEVTEWSPPATAQTLGLNAESHQHYLAFVDRFKLIPPDALLYFSGDETFDRVFLQSLLGFESDWRKDMTDEEREKRYELMALLGQARYLSEFPVTQRQGVQLAQWQETLESTLLAALDVKYVLCRQDRANPSIEYCPKGIADSPQYKLIGAWNLDPLYETYTLYQIESARANR